MSAQNSSVARREELERNPESSEFCLRDAYSETIHETTD